MRESQPAVPAGELGQPGTPDGGAGLTSTASMSGGRPPCESVELAPGVHVDRFRIVGHLGGGGMGVVYEAYDPELDRMLALKLLRPDASSSSGRARARLLREAQAAARLAHPNVVAIYDVGAVGDRIFVAMERVVGRDLAAWRAQRERSLGEIIDVFVQAGRGLAAAHKAGLVHRDVKPHNILVGDDGRVRVVDFGLARAGGRGDSSGDSLDDTSRDDTRPDDVTPASTAATPPPATAGTTTATTGNFGLLDASITIPGDVLGTPAYMAPEQHRCEPIRRESRSVLVLRLAVGGAGRRPAVRRRLGRGDPGAHLAPRSRTAAAGPAQAGRRAAPRAVAAPLRSLSRARPAPRRARAVASRSPPAGGRRCGGGAGGGRRWDLRRGEHGRAAGVPRRPRRRVGWRGSITGPARAHRRRSARRKHRRRRHRRARSVGGALGRRARAGMPGRAQRRAAADGERAAAGLRRVAPRPPRRACRSAGQRRR